MELKAIATMRKTGNERFSIANTMQNISLCDYWSWAHSDLIVNTERGKLAEFIVASALGVHGNLNSMWNSFDLLYNGKGIEVKSASYVQSWRQTKESYISFSVRPTVGVIEDTGTYDNDRKRQSSAYVFCLLKHKDKQTVNPLDLNQWKFYVVPTALLDMFIPTQKTIVLSFFEKNGIAPCSYAEIRSHVELAIGETAENE